jgi:hypothetical protein
MDRSTSLVPTTTAEHHQRIRVDLSDLIVDQAFQARDGADAALVLRYADAMKVGIEFPPITVMRVEGSLYLADGFHRVAAMWRLGITETEALYSDGDKYQLIWAAASANITHGKGYTKREMRTVFRAYVHSRQHRKGKRGFKSAREIGKDLQGIFHGTVLKWMAADFPSVHAKMSGKEPEATGGPRGPRVDLAERRAELVRAALAVVQSNSKGVSAGERGMTIAMVKDLLERLETSGPYEPVLLDNDGPMAF